MGGIVINRPSVRVLGMSNVAIPLTGTVAITALVTISVPAGVMGLNGVLRVTTTWTCTNNANAKTARFNFGAAGSGTGGTQYLSSNLASTTGTRDMRMVANRGSVSSQFGMPAGTPVGGWGTTAGALCTTTVDTSAASEICICGTLASSGDTLTLESYSVELMTP